MAFASHYQLDNIVAIMDVNRLGQSEAAPLQHDMETYRKRCEAFGSVPNFFHFLWNTCIQLWMSVITYQLTISQVKMSVSTFWPFCPAWIFNMYSVWGSWFVFICFWKRWNTYVVDGHSVEELCKAFWQAQKVQGKPTCIVAKTFKGKGLKSECGVLISYWREKIILCMLNTLLFCI